MTLVFEQHMILYVCCRFAEPTSVHNCLRNETHGTDDLPIGYVS
jgi:hypothetical protein